MVQSCTIWKRAIPAAVESIRYHEGLRLRVYQDSLGHYTVGYGHLLRDTEEKNQSLSVITKEKAESLLHQDVADTIRDFLRIFPDTDHMNAPRRAVVMEMLFNLGRGRFKEFTNTIAAIRNGDWKLAGEEMLDSLWALQVKGRAYRLARQMRRGIFWMEEGKLADG